MMRMPPPYVVTGVGLVLYFSSTVLRNIPVIGALAQNSLTQMIAGGLILAGTSWQLVNYYKKR